MVMLKKAIPEAKRSPAHVPPLLKPYYGFGGATFRARRVPKIAPLDDWLPRNSGGRRTIFGSNALRVFGLTTIGRKSGQRRVLGFVRQRPGSSDSERILTTVFFTDIVGSTEQLSAQGDERWRHQLDIHDALVETLLAKYGGKCAKHTGDGVFALFDGPTKAAQCGLELVPALATRGIHIRAGIHVGECERRGEEWCGMAVHVGARIGAMAGPGEVLASRTVRDLSAGSGLTFEDLGAHQLKGLPEDMNVFRVTDWINRRHASDLH